MGEPEGGFELCERYEVTGESGPYVTLVFPADFLVEERYVDEEAAIFDRADCSGAEAGGDRDAGGGSDPAGRDNRTNIA